MGKRDTSGAMLAKVRRFLAGSREWIRLEDLAQYLKAAHQRLMLRGIERLQQRSYPSLCTVVNILQDLAAFAGDLDHDDAAIFFRADADNPAALLQRSYGARHCGQADA